jgi:hypothetical protein
MERSLSNDDALRRYEAIEKAYCEGRWATVVEAGTVLLRELPQGGDHNYALFVVSNWTFTAVMIPLPSRCWPWGQLVW